mgnify:CR=1 FL=1|tara:strand:- start:387 stop:1028 length:642 start_codon:yes stop_codon:yes gene_type:complete
MNEFKKRLLTSIIVTPLALFFVIKGHFFFIFFLCTILVISIYEWSRLSKNLYFFKVLGIVFVILSIYSAYLLRKEQGYLFFFFIISISILSDLGGYFFGKLFNGPKLTKISPNKTYSGVFGSFLFSIMGGLFLMKSFFISLTLSNGLIEICLIILSISLVSQLGDLIISYFKRKSKIKDTGKILPGHGGLLDRIDGIIFSVPYSYIVFNYLFH